MDNVSILGGTTTLSDVYIPNGATVSVSGGGLAVEKVAGSGTIDLGGTNIFVGYKEAMQVEGCVFAGGSASSNGIITASSATIVLKDVTFSSNTVAGSVIYCSRTPFSISGCRIDGTVNAANTCITDFSDGSLIENSFVSGSALAIYTTDPHLAISGSTIGLIILRGGTIYLGGVNNIEKITSQNASRFGDVVVSSGASVNLTSGIVPGGRITVLDGGCTVNGVSVPGGTYSTITSDAGSDIIVT
jgi:hypothetical protein